MLHRMAITAAVAFIAVSGCQGDPKPTSGDKIPLMQLLSNVCEARLREWMMDVPVPAMSPSWSNLCVSQSTSAASPISCET
jgi:hypothetical protein